MATSPNLFSAGNAILAIAGLGRRSESQGFTRLPVLAIRASTAQRHIEACPNTRRSAVMATSPNCRGGTRQRRGFCSSMLTAPA